MRELPLFAPPGTVWSYNNAGFALAGRVVEVVTGRSIQDALRTLVFEPIGLTRAFTRIEDLVTNGSLCPPQPGRHAGRHAADESTALSPSAACRRSHDASHGASPGRRTTKKRVMPRTAEDARAAAAESRDHTRWASRGICARWWRMIGRNTPRFAFLFEPVSSYVLAILTNHAEGWRSSDVERIADAAGVTLDPAHDRSPWRQRDDAGHADSADTAGRRTSASRRTPNAR
jgi:CubicO group peptidase (beta-lactamase class C family)